jgi:hypothetical protein
VSITTEIKKAKEKLMKKAEKTGIYENFGQTEVRKLCDKYYPSSVPVANLINDFNQWCMTYNGGKE